MWIIKILHIFDFLRKVTKDRDSFGQWTQRTPEWSAAQRSQINRELSNFL